MKSMVIFYRNLLKAASFSLLYASILLIISGVVSVIDEGGFAEISLSFLLPFYTVYYSTKNAQKGAAASFCLLSGTLVYHSLTENFFSLVFVVIVSALLSLVFYKMRISYAVLTCFCVLFVIALSFGLLHPLLFEYLKAIAKLISGRGALFGALNEVYSLFISDDFNDLFYNTAYSKSELISGKIVSGAVNIFKADSNNSVCAEYLTGKFFVNVFLTLGVFVSLIKSMRDDLKLAFVLSCICAVTAGNTLPFALFLLVYNPVLYAAYILVTAVSYIIPPLINLNIGFEENASIISLVKYGNSWGYFLITGVVLAVLTYFVCRLVLSRFKLSYGRFYPKKVRKIISSLGGEENIVSIKNEAVRVSNPNMVNILTLDCDIHGDRVSLNPDDLELIAEYF